MKSASAGVLIRSVPPFRASPVGPATPAATNHARPKTSITTAGASLRAIYFLQTVVRFGPK